MGVSQISSFIGGILGGLSILSYIPPKDTKEAFMRGGVSVGFALMFAQPILLSIGLEIKPSDLWMYELGISFLCGFIGYSVMNWVANFLAKNQNKDIMEVGRELKTPRKKSQEEVAYAFILTQSSPSDKYCFAIGDLRWVLQDCV